MQQNLYCYNMVLSRRVWPNIIFLKFWGFPMPFKQMKLRTWKPLYKQRVAMNDTFHKQIGRKSAVEVRVGMTNKMT